MAVLKPRSRTVTFRVSAEEFSALTATCENSDSRSISDFARAAVLHKIRSAGRKHNQSGELSTLGKALEELDVALGDVSKAIRSLPVAAVNIHETRFHDEPEGGREYLTA